MQLTAGPLAFMPVDWGDRPLHHNGAHSVVPQNSYAFEGTVGIRGRAARVLHVMYLGIDSLTAILSNNYIKGHRFLLGVAHFVAFLSVIYLSVPRLVGGLATDWFQNPLIRRLKSFSAS